MARSRKYSKRSRRGSKKSRRGSKKSRRGSKKSRRGSKKSRRGSKRSRRGSISKEREAALKKYFKSFFCKHGKNANAYLWKYNNSLVRIGSTDLPTIKKVKKNLKC